MNVKNNTIYSDKFILSVVDLNYIELATEEDRGYRIDYWASLFKAKTWEDIKMLAKNNTYIQEASETIYQLTADAAIREQCEARNAYYARERHHAKIQKAYEEATEQIDALTVENETLTTKNDELTTKNDELTTKNDELTTKNDTLLAENADLKKEIEDLKARLAGK